MAAENPVPSRASRIVRGVGVPLAIFGLSNVLGPSPASAETSVASSAASFSSASHHPDRGPRTRRIDMHCGPNSTGSAPDLVDLYIPYKEFGGDIFWIVNGDRPDYFAEVHPSTKTVELIGSAHNPIEKDKRLRLASHGERLDLEPKQNSVKVTGYCPPVDVDG